MTLTPRELIKLELDEVALLWNFAAAENNKSTASMGLLSLHKLLTALYASEDNITLEAVVPAVVELKNILVKA